MAFTYSLKPRGGDIHDVAPYWFAAFIRFDRRDTFTRANMSSTPQNSSAVSVMDGIKEQAEILIADGDCINWNVQSSKTSHVSGCSLTLVNGEVNYVAELASGDWMGFWVFDNKQDFLRVRDLVRNRKSCNGFLDGLKFVGRVDSVRRVKARSPSGALTTSYSVSGMGFGEFDSHIYYSNYFKAKYGNDALLWMIDFGGSANNLLLGATRHKGLISSQEVMPKLLRICLGMDQPKDGGNTSVDSQLVAEDYQDKQQQNIALHGTVNKGYLVPPTVGDWLGAESQVKGALSYVDILRTYIGIQSYSGGTGEREDAGLITNFVPNYREKQQNVYLMNEDLTGEYRVLTMHFDNRSVWSILQTYVNEPIDEMYTCMRVDPNGKIMPSLVVRQNPLSTKWYAENGKWKVTAFTDLPRWKLSTDLVTSEDVGRGNALRFNYVHLLGQDMTGSNPDNGVVNFVRTPPIVDPTDINRSGLRMFERQLSANVNEGQYNNDTSPGAKWQEIMADILMGSHLKYSGTIVCKGIQEPICEGDNLEYDDVIYHIERVVHSGQIAPFGGKDFTTTIYVTNGLPLANETNGDLVEVVYPDLDKKDEDDAGIVEQE